MSCEAAANEVSAAAWVIVVWRMVVDVSLPDTCKIVSVIVIVAQRRAMRDRLSADRAWRLSVCRVNLCRGLQLVENDAIRIMRAARRSIDSRLQANLVVA